MKLNISKKITLFAGLIVLVISVNMGLAGILTGTSIILEQQEETALVLADEGAKRIDTEITMRLQVLSELANNEKITSMNWDIQKIYLSEQIERFAYLDMAVVQLDGTTRYAASSEIAQLGDREYIKKALTGIANISEVLISRVTGEPVVMFAAPIESNGKIQGVLIARGDANALSEITDQLGMGDRGYAFVIGADSTLFAHPNHELVLNQTNVYQQIDENGALKDYGLALKKLGIGNRGIVQYDYEGEKRFTAMSPVPNTNWVIGVGNFERDVRTPMLKMQGIILAITLGYLILGILAGTYLGKFISNPIKKLLAIVDRMSRYDFSMSTESQEDLKFTKRKDEIGEIGTGIFNMIKSIASLVQMVSESTEHVAASSQELTSITQQSSELSNELDKTIEEIAKGASEQAQDTERGAKGIFELNKLIVQEQQNIEHLNNSAAVVDKLKNEGLMTLDKLNQKTDESRNAAMDIFDAINKTNASVENIEQGSEMIKTIAKQTNMLALNAAIEAARAGETGKGFAVVAQEIRLLAAQSNQFANEIMKEIQELAQRTGSMVDTMNQVGGIVEDQTKSVEDTNRSFEGIHEAVENMKAVISRLNESSDVMEKEKDALIVILNNLSAVSEEFAAGTEEAAASVEQQSVSIDEIAKSSEALSKLAENLQTVVSKFKY